MQQIVELKLGFVGTVSLLRKHEMSFRKCESDFQLDLEVLSVRFNQWVPEVKRPGREADHSPPCSAEVKNAWSYTSVRLHGVMLS
jgi:hypothetical protein